MACGVPVVAARVPGLSEVVGDPALLFDGGDTDALVQTVETLLANPDIYAASSRAAIERSRLYDAKRMASGYLGVYEALVGLHDRSK
jgi:glycosyltransferase involved in cell wall biosynthesis